MKKVSPHLALLAELRRATALVERLRRACDEAGVGMAAAVPADIAAIQAVVCRATNTDPVMLVARDRHEPVVTHRHIAMHLCREMTGRTLQEIARAFGGRDHGAVIHACRRIANRMATEPVFATAVREISLKAITPNNDHR